MEDSRHAAGTEAARINRKAGQCIEHTFKVRFNTVHRAGRIVARHKDHLSTRASSQAALGARPLVDELEETDEVSRAATSSPNGEVTVVTKSFMQDFSTST